MLHTLHDGPKKKKKEKDWDDDDDYNEDVEYDDGYYKEFEY